MKIGALTISGTDGSISIVNNGPLGSSEADTWRFAFDSRLGAFTDPSGANFDRAFFTAHLPTSAYSDTSLPGDFTPSGLLEPISAQLLSIGTNFQSVTFAITSSTTGPVPETGPSPDPAVIPLPASAAALLAGIAALAGSAALRRRKTG